MSTDASADDRSGLVDGSLLGGRYRLGELLGVGSSAAVFAAVDVTAGPDDPPIAVKVLHAHLCQNRDTLMAFLREGKAASTVRHPGVVRVYGWGTHEAGGLSVGWLALQRIDGGNLSDLVAERGRLTPQDAVAAMYGVLDGLAAIHEAGLVHRDVTPRNVLVAGVEDDAITSDCIHIADLGLADVTGSTALIGNREVAGTPAYISPEQVLGHPVDARADLYQAGALLYFLVTGQTPYPRSTTEKIIHAHLYAPPPVPSAHVREAAPLDRVVTRALSKQPASRFQSAGEFRTALEVALPDVAPSMYAPRAIDATAVLATATTPASYLPVVPIASDSAPYRRARSESRVGIVAAVVIALLVMVPVVQTILPGAASAISTVAQSSPSASSTATAVVPLLTGTLQDVQGALGAQGFVVGQVTQRNSSESEGRLLSQNPQPGSLAPRGSAVDLVIASGRNAVPQLAGLTFTAATAQLKAAGFVAAGQASSGSLVGGSTPAGGQVVRVGSTVTLVASAATPTPTPSPSESIASASVSQPSGTPTGTTTASASASATRTTSPTASGGA
jgi:serine/threonine protein kinase